MTNTIGIIAMIILMVAGVPQAIKAIKDGHSNGVDGKYLTLLISGFVLMSIYILLTNPLWPVLLTYIVNIFIMSIVAYFKAFPRMKNDE